MNPMEFLENLEHIEDNYIVAAGEFRQGRRAVSLKRTWLLAAVIALTLLLVGCVAYSRGWFVGYYENRSDVPLSDSQITLIQEKEQMIGETETKNGWTVALRSAIRDGNKAYVILGITAPEGVNLKPKKANGINLEWFSPGNAGNSLQLDQNPTNLVIHPRGVFPGSISTEWREDGDGLDNTKNYIIGLEPDLSRSTVDPFSTQAQWRITVQGIVRNYDDEEYKQHLLDTKYKGDYGVMFTNEETKRIQQQEILTEEKWVFTVTFAEQGQESDRLELLSAPMRTEAEFIRRYGSGKDMDYVWHREEITLTSVLVQPFSVTISYDDSSIYALDQVSPRFYFMDDALSEDPVLSYAVMKDGTRLWLLSNGGGENYTLLEAESPIVLSELDYILLPDGDKVYTDGTVEYGPEPESPAAAAAYRNIHSDSGIYAYYADFDGDALEDMAIWYDGTFRNLCLLDEQGECKKEFTFENGMDVYETYNQRSEEIRWESNLIRILETQGDVTTTYFYRATTDGLVLSAAVKQALSSTAEEYFLIQEDEAEVSVSKSEFEAVSEDYQVMHYRLQPVS